jgi:predicted metal-dependent TIM-barrel fold hydrolase
VLFDEEVHFISWRTPAAQVVKTVRVRMNYIEPHGHMVSRTTDDYERMALAGCQAICEPAFWAGFDRASADGFYDYFRQITEYEPKRAPSSASSTSAGSASTRRKRRILKLAARSSPHPEFIDKPGVLGIGEIGLNKNSRNELAIFESTCSRAGSRSARAHPHAAPRGQAQGHPPHPRCAAFSKIKPERVIIDHVEEHTIDHKCSIRLLGRHHALSREQMLLDRAIDMLGAPPRRAHLDELRLRLGRQRSPRRAQDIWRASWRAGSWRGRDGDGGRGGDVLSAKLVESGKVQGVISLGGGGGTAIGTAAMRAHCPLDFRR